MSAEVITSPLPSPMSSPSDGEMMHQEISNDRITPSKHFLFENVHQMVTEDSSKKHKSLLLHTQETPTKCIVEAISISYPDARHVSPIIMMPHTGIRYNYTLKEGEFFDVDLLLYVAEDIHNQQFSNYVKKFHLNVDTTKRNQGSLSAREEPYVIHAIHIAAPKGFFMRGSYTGEAQLTSDRGQVIKFTYDLKIAKDYAK